MDIPRGSEEPLESWSMKKGDKMMAFAVSSTEIFSAFFWAISQSYRRKFSHLSDQVVLEINKPSVGVR